MPQYVSTFRAVYDAADDVAAAVIAEQVRENGAQDLDEEEGDSFECTQTTSNAIHLSPEEILDRLRGARNLLINTRVRIYFELAREVDKAVHLLQSTEPPEVAMGTYDYGKFMDLAQQILIDKEAPSA